MALPTSIDAEAAAVFHNAMVEITRLVAADAVGQVDDLGPAQTIVDAGGSHGRLLTASCSAGRRW